MSYPLRNESLGADEFILGDKIYDISSFKKIHPGGSIIGFFTGTDATNPFNEFHFRSEKAKKTLATLPSRPLDKQQTKPQHNPELLKDFAELRRQFEKEGYFDPSPVHIFLRLLELLVMHVIGIYLIGWSSWRYLGLIIFSIANGRVGWFMHECGHGSMTGNLKVDKFMQEIAFAIGNTCSGSYWNNQHNKHHACPQKLQHDVDLNTLPLVAFCKDVLQDKKRFGGFSKLWINLQAFLFAPVVTWLVVIGWAVYIHPRWMVRNKKYLEMFFYTIRLLFDYYFLGMWFWWLNAVIGGMYIFVNFSLSHTHLPTIAAAEFPNWIEYAANHTVNIEPSWWCNWWMGYLNFQIEHHLFPSMPQFKHQYIAPRVKALFEKHNLKYLILSYSDAMKTTFGNLHEVGNSV